MAKTYEISIGEMVLGDDLCRFIFVWFGEGRIVVIDDGDYWMSDCNSYGRSPSLIPRTEKQKSQWRLKTNEKKDKIMTTAPNQTKSVNSSVQDEKKQKAAPSHEAVEKMAYKIWLSQGQQPGCDQKNWFEAEAQLKAA